MFDYLRVAAVATLSLGAVGTASGQILPALPQPSLAASTTTGEPQPNAIEPRAQSRLSAAIVEGLTDPEPLAELQATTPETLAALVRRHAASDTVDAEQECLAVATYFEAKGEPLAGQLAVARVILNRAASGRFARTACGVVRQPSQFSFVRDGAFPAIARASSNWRTAVAIARIAEQGLHEAPAATALYFHAKRVAPSWRMTRVASVGNHVFYR